MGDVLKLIYVPIAIIALLGGALAYILYAGIPLADVAAGVQSLFSPIFSAWSRLPTTVQNLILVGVPSAISLFMAWTKMRAMNQLSEVQQKAAQQITQVEGEKAVMEEQLKTSSAQGLEGLITQRDSAVQARDEAQNLLTGAQSQMRDLQVRHDAEVKGLRNIINDLKLKEKIVVK